MAIEDEQVIYEGEWMRLTALYENGEWALDPDVAKLNAPTMDRATIAAFAGILLQYLELTKDQAAP